MLLALTMAATPPPQPPDPGPGVPLSLAEARARRVSDVRYDLQFGIPESPADPIHARATVTFLLKDVSAPLVLDFAAPPANIVRVTDGHRALPYRVANEHLVIPATSLREGDNTIRIEFVAGDASLNRNAGLPLHAVRAGPRAPGVSLLRSAGPEGAVDADARDSRRVGGARQRRRDRRANRAAAGRGWRFAETPPLSTYLFAFAAGKFSDRDGASATAARSGCSTARPTPPRSRATATRSSICTPRRSPGSSTTRASRIRSASSTSCWCRRSSSAAWSTPARSSTTRRA